MLCLFVERTQYLQMDKSAHFWLSTDLAFIVTSIQCCHIPVRFQIFKLTSETFNGIPCNKSATAKK